MDAALGYTEEAFPALPPYLHLLGARRELLGQLKQAALPRPGLTTATQHSKLPLPLPIRTPIGLPVTGLSGKILINTLPPRLI